MTHPHPSRASLVWIALGLAAAVGTATAFQATALSQSPGSSSGRTPPKLVVLFVVDQFRADYVST